MSNKKKTNPEDLKAQAIKNDIYLLRDAIEMVEWCIDKQYDGVHLWVEDLQPKLEEVLKHFRN